MAEIKCPGCDLELDEEDFAEQEAHMLAEHPDIVEQRLVESHFTRDPATGKWEDGWAADG
jgi:sarcosine oxidase delta subunit